MSTSTPQKTRVECPGCGSSLRAGADLVGRTLNCPKCSQPIELRLVAFSPGEPTKAPSWKGKPAVAKPADPSKPLLVSHPAMFRNSPILFLIVVMLCFLGVGLPIMFVWWLTTLTSTLTITGEKSVCRRGLLSKRTNEVWHRDVRNVQISQSFFQRIFGVGRIGISSAGQSGVEIEMVGIRNPEKVKSLIDSHR